MRDHGHTLLLPVARTQHCMPLPIFQHHVAHGLVGNFFNLPVQGFCQEVIVTGIYHQHPRI